MTQQNQSNALDLIYDLALQLKSKEDLSEIRAGLDEIQALARYQFDVGQREDQEDEA